MAVALGDYITFEDNDDWLENNMYAILMENAQKYGADISGCATNGHSVCKFDGRNSEIVFGDNLCLDVLYQNRCSWGTMWNMKILWLSP